VLTKLYLLLNMDNPSPNSSKQFISVSDLFKESIDTYKAHWKLYASIQAIPLGISLMSILTEIVLPNAAVVGFYTLASIIASGFSWLALLWVITHNEDLSWKESYRKGLTLAIPATIVGVLAAAITL